MTKKIVLSIILLSALLSIATSCQPPTPETAPCIGFREYIDGDQFPNPWELIGFKFTGNTALIIGAANNINGLKIEEAGLRVELPGTTEDVTIQAMAFGTLPITIDAVDSNKNYVDQVTVPDDDTLHIVHLSANEISTVIFSGGDNEAFLIEICMGNFYQEGQ